MIIYWRVCETQETGSYLPRWNNKDKREILRKCWLSLQSGITKEDTIVVLWEKVRQATLDWLAAHCSTSNLRFIECPMYQFDEATKKDLNGLLDKRNFTFINVISVIDNISQQYPQEIHYLCEDDYLHLPTAIPAMKSVFEQNWTGFLVPYDYPDRYNLDKTRQTELLLNNYSHWRTIPCSTGCTSALGTTWQQYMHLIKQSAIYNSDSFSWEIYSKSGALCPVPGLSTHLTENCMSPRVNWESVYNAIPLEGSWNE